MQRENVKQEKSRQKKRGMKTLKYGEKKVNAQKYTQIYIKM